MCLQHWWVRKEHLMSSTWTCGKHLALSHKTALSLEWADRDLVGVTWIREWLDDLTQSWGQQLTVQGRAGTGSIPQGPVLGLAQFNTSLVTPFYEPVIMAFLYDLLIFLKDTSDFTSSLMSSAKPMAQLIFVSGSNRECVHHEDNLLQPHGSDPVQLVRLKEKGQSSTPEHFIMAHYHL